MVRVNCFLGGHCVALLRRAKAVVLNLVLSVADVRGDLKET